MRGLVFLSNVRCGSTHLVTTLGKLKSVYADCEIKWRMGQLNTPAHLHLDEDAPSFADLLQGFETRVRWRGSKFVLHAQNPMKPGDIAALRAALDRDRARGVVFVHLTRDYFSICLSTLLRGNWNRMAAPDKAENAPAFRLQIAQREAERGDMVDEMEVGIPHRPVTFTLMVRTMLRLLANDLALSEMTGPDVLRLEYDRIDCDLAPVLAAAGLSKMSLASLPGALARPMIRKLQPLDPARLPISAGFRALCAYCDFLREEVLSGRMAPCDVLGPPDYGPGRPAAPEIVDPNLRRMRAQMRSLAEGQEDTPR